VVGGGPPGQAREQKTALPGGLDSTKLPGIVVDNLTTNGALMTAEECRRWQRPWDLRILAAVEGAPFNLLHVCGTGIHFEEFADYPVTALSFATVPGNPGLAAARARSGRAVVGGLPAKPEIAEMTEAALLERAAAARREMEDRWLLLGPDCSINPDTPERLLHAVGAAVRQATS